MKFKRAEKYLRHPREKHPVPIVADAAISTRGLHGGRFLTGLLLDTSDRPDIAEFIRIHQSLGPGDVNVQWGQIGGHEGTVALFLTFIRPMELFMSLEFDIVRQGILVDQMLTSNGMYLMQAKNPDDRLKYDVDRPKVIVEVPDVGFRKLWDGLFHKHLAKHFRAMGQSRSDSRSAALSAISEFRKLGSLRMRDVHE